MINMVKLTKFHISTEWDDGKPTNSQILTDVYINPEQIQVIEMREYFVPEKEGNTILQKVMIIFGHEVAVYVNEPLEDVLKIVQDL